MQDKPCRVTIDTEASVDFGLQVLSLSREEVETRSTTTIIPATLASDQVIPVRCEGGGDGAASIHPEGG
jgi:hypothetical protein